MCFAISWSVHLSIKYFHQTQQTCLTEWHWVGGLTMMTYNLWALFLLLFLPAYTFSFSICWSFKKNLSISTFQLKWLYIWSAAKKWRVVKCESFWICRIQIFCVPILLIMSQGILKTKKNHNYLFMSIWKLNILSWMNKYSYGDLWCPHITD